MSDPNAHASVRSSDLRLLALSEAIPHVYLRIRRGGTILEFASKNLNTLLSDMSDMKGRSALDLPLPTDLRERFIDHAHSALDTGQGKCFSYKLEIGDQIVFHEARFIPCTPDEVLCLLLDVTEQKRTELALLESEQRYRTIVEQQDDVICRWFPDTTLTFMNASYSRIFAEKDGRQIGQRWIDFVPEVSRPTVEDYLKTFRAKPCPTTHEAWASLASGEMHWFQWRDLPFFDGDGNLMEIQSTGRDITPLKLAQNAIQEQARFLQILIDTIPSPIFFKDTKGRYQGCNKAYEDFCGKTRDQIIGASTQEVWPAERAALYHQRDQELLKNPHTQTFETHLSGLEEKPQHWITIRAANTDDQGTVLGIVGIIVDITAQKENEAALERSEKLYRTLVKHAPFSVVMLDGETITFANPAAIRLLGASNAEELQGRSVIDFIALPSRPLVQERIQHATKGNSNAAVEMELQRMDGSAFAAESLSVPVDIDGRRFMMIMGHEITERKHAEDLARHALKLESLGLMAGGIAHDFNNLFQAILGNLEVLRGNLGDESKKVVALERAIRILDKASNLAQRMLEYAGKSSLLEDRVDLNILIEQQRAALKGLAPTSIAVELHLEPGLPAVMADANRLIQILEGLVANAVEAMAPGKGNIEIATELREVSCADRLAGYWVESPPEGPLVCITIKDNGPGIGSGLMCRIFDPFITTKEFGRGLGLSAVLGIIRAHKAGLQVMSEEGRGTLFRICMKPFRPPTDKLPLTPTTHVVRPRTVLLVDSDEDLRTALADIIRNFMGIPTLEAQDGLEALEVFKEHTEKIGLVIMDITLPRMRGVETFQAIRNLQPDTRAILMSGCREDQGLQLAAQHGFLTFLKKPFPMKDLQKAIRDAMVK